MRPTAFPIKKHLAKPISKKDEEEEMDIYEEEEEMDLYEGISYLHCMAFIRQLQIWNILG